jgi:glycogen debranching enzyme
MNYRVIKENDLFFLTDESGDIPENHPYGPGLYTKDTRFLSKFDLLINNEKPILLSSQADKSYYAEMLLTNPHIEKAGEVELWRESIEIKRKRFIYEEVLYEEIIVKNYNPKRTTFNLSIHLDADFKDMFIVRGFQNGKTGVKAKADVSSEGMKLNYIGADEVKRELSVNWNLGPSRTSSEGDVYFDFNLEHAEERTLVLNIAPSVNQEKPQILPYGEAFNKLMTSYTAWNETLTKVETNHQPLQKLVDRGLGDMKVLLTDLGYGKFPVAGLPWFGVPFGRDSLIAALQMLPFNPEVAEGTLKTMAAHQGTKKDSWRDEEPGKIMHEMRFGELANTGQIPFTPYYGTIDATPLFLVLLGEYLKWTGNFSLFTELEENVENALTWINQYGDRDGDEFVEYHQEASKGIANQGWKDSGDSMVHRNGDLAETPIALSEVQGYVYHAKQSMAEVYHLLDKEDKAAGLKKQAQELERKFEESFWMEDQQYYALALDKEKEQVGTITSNPGHVLFSEMLSKEKAEIVSERLVSKKMFSGYGIRTMAEEEAGYNPMSYHNGTVWPHDNSLIILGMSKTKNQRQAVKAMEGLINSSFHFEYDRLPELFCGYNSEKPVIAYPVACSPQAWAAGTPLLFVQSILGLFPDALKKQITINPMLPKNVDYLKVENMKIHKGTLDLVVRRTEERCETEVLKNTTGCETVMNDQIVKN